MRCDFCQNYNISQIVPEHGAKKMTADDMVRSAISAYNNIGMAFTYNEPVVWFEFLRDVAVRIREAGLKTVIVSNGYVNSYPLGEIIGFMDAFNIDLKAFSDPTYRKLTGAGLEPVKNSLRMISRSGRHLEITSLIIPGQNDSEEEMLLQSEWIAGELGKDVPFHLSRYYPMYKRGDPATSLDTLRRLYDVAASKLTYVYIGNLHTSEGQNTICPGCGKTLVHRTGYNIRIENLDDHGKCTQCGTPVIKHFTFS
jgi:pyruvate formate lyase activating enzyme